MMTKHAPLAPLRGTTTFASWILGRPVHDAEGRLVGKLADFLVEHAGSTVAVTALVLRDRKATYQVPGAALVGIGAPLTLRPGSYPRIQVPEQAIHLIRDVLDAQVIDTRGAKVIRVNDLQLDWVGDRLVVSGVDIGPWGIARRLGVARGLAWLVCTFGLRVAEGLVPWSAIMPVDPGFHALRLRVPSAGVRGLHPADLADIIEELGHQQRQQLLTELSDAQIADVVEESGAEMQAAILHGLGPDRAADVLEEMEPDEAADLLADLPEHQAQDLMGRMEPEEAAAVQELLTYPEGTAGAMMTPAFLTLDARRTVSQALHWFRETRQKAEVVSYVYLHDGSGRLSGVVSLRRLLVAAEDLPLAELSVGQLVHAWLDSPSAEVADLVVRYNLLALPVVDTDEHLVGVVTVHDVLASLLPARER